PAAAVLPARLGRPRASVRGGGPGPRRGLDGGGGDGKPRDRFLAPRRPGGAGAARRQRRGGARLGHAGGVGPHPAARRRLRGDVVNAPEPDPILDPAPEQAAAAHPAISVRHLSHRYGKFEVLHDVSFQVDPGEIFGFIGPNGAGKTTTIRVMASLLEPSSGQVEIDGIDVVTHPLQVRRLIGYMPDHAGVYDRITVREYLEFFAQAYRVEPDVVGVVLELTDLNGLSNRLVAA